MKKWLMFGVGAALAYWAWKRFGPESTSVSGSSANKVAGNNLTGYPQ